MAGRRLPVVPLTGFALVLLVWLGAEGLPATFSGACPRLSPCPREEGCPLQGPPAAPLPMALPQARPAGGSLGPRPAVLPTTRKSALPAGRPLTLPKNKGFCQPCWLLSCPGGTGWEAGVGVLPAPQAHRTPAAHTWQSLARASQSDREPQLCDPSLPGLETQSTVFPTRAWRVWPSTHCGSQGQLPAPTWPTSQGCPELQC